MHLAYWPQNYQLKTGWPHPNHMSTYLKFKPAWLQLVVFGSLVFGIYLVLGNIALLGVSAYYGISISDIQYFDVHAPGMLPAIRLVQMLLSIIIFLVPVMVFAYLSDRRPFRYIGLRPPLPPHFWWLSVLVMFLAFPAASWINQLNQNIHLPAFLKETETAMRAAEKSATDLTNAMLQMDSPSEFLLVLFILAVIPAVGEELFFRGVLQRLFIQINQRPWVGIVITAIIFSAFHGQFLGFFTRLLLGILLGALYWYSGSIWPSIIAHFFNNALQVILVYHDKSFIDKEPRSSPVLVILSVLAVIALLWYMKKISHTHYGEIYDTDEEMVLPNPDENSNEN